MPNYYYDLPSGNVTDFVSMFVYLNNISNGYFGIMFMFSLFIIFFASFRKYPLVINLTASVFLSFVFSLLMWLMGIVRLEFVVIWILGLTFLIFWRWKE